MGDSLPESDATVLGGAGDAEPVPAPVPRRPRVWPIFVTVVLAVLATMGEAIALLIIQGWRPSSPNAGPALDARTIEWLLISTELTLVAAALIAARPFSPARLGLARGRTTVRSTLAATVGAVAASYLGSIAVTALGAWKYGRTLPWLGGLVAQSEGVGRVRVVLELALLAGVAEELFFRGFMQRRFVERWPRWVGISVTAACFALMHGDPVQSPLTLGLGLWLGYVADRTDSIWPAIAAHTANNALAVVDVGVRWPLPPNVTSAGAVIMFAVAAADIRRLPRRGGSLWGRSSTDPS